MVLEESTIESAQRGDREAFRQIVERCSNLVYAAVVGKVGDFNAAQDVAQEVFLKAYLRLPQLEEPAKFGGWLRAVANRAAMDWLRDNRSRHRLGELGELEDHVFEEELRRRQDRSEVWKALGTLCAFRQSLC